MLVNRKIEIRVVFFLLVFVLSVGSQFIQAEEKELSPNNSQPTEATSEKAVKAPEDQAKPEIRRTSRFVEENHEFKEVNVGTEVVSLLTTFGIVIFLLVFAGWFFKRFFRKRMLQMNRGSEVKILERRSLAPKTNIYLLEIRGQGYVIGETPAGLVSLGDFPTNVADNDEEEEEPVTSAFGKMLNEKIDKKG